MKPALCILLFAIAASGQAPRNSLGGTRHHFAGPKPKEWAKTVRIPPCGHMQHLEVIWPKDFHGSVTIECNNLPLPSGTSYR